MLVLNAISAILITIAGLIFSWFLIGQVNIELGILYFGVACLGLNLNDILREQAINYFNKE